MEAVRQIADVAFAEELSSVEEMELGIADLLTSFDDIGDEPADAPDGERAVRQLSRAVEDGRRPVADDRRTRVIFAGGVDDRRDDEQRRVRVAVAQGVEEAV